MREADSLVRSQTDRSHTEGRNEIPVRGTRRKDGTRESERPKGLDLQSALEYVSVRRSDDKIVGKALRRVVNEGTPAEIAGFTAGLVKLLGQSESTCSTVAHQSGHGAMGGHSPNSTSDRESYGEIPDPQRVEDTRAYGPSLGLRPGSTEVFRKGLRLLSHSSNNPRPPFCKRPKARLPSAHSTQRGTLRVLSWLDGTIHWRVGVAAGRGPNRWPSGSLVWAGSNRLDVGDAERPDSTFPLPIEIPRIVSAVVVASNGSSSLRVRFSGTPVLGRCDRFGSGPKTDEWVAATCRWRNHG